MFFRNQIWICGTVTQQSEIQGYATLRTERKAIEGMKVSDTSFWKTGFITSDDSGE